jgi:hypothetical protein
MGDFQYLEKPLDFNFLAERIFDALEAGASPDRIHGISLAAFLQLLEMEGKTCTLTVKSRGQEGHLYFVKGVLIQAEMGEVKGEEAALAIVTWDNVAMEIQYTCTVKKKSIGLPLAEILMEGFRIKDEKESVKGREGTMDVKKLNEVLQGFKKDMGDALFATDIWTTADGQIIAGLNPQPAAAALFNRITLLINDALKTAKFPLLNRYYLLHLEGGNTSMAMQIGDYQWGILVDLKKVQLGLLLNVEIPKIMDAIKEAIAV